MRLAHYWGVIPKHYQKLTDINEEEPYMLIKTMIHVLNVKKESYTDRDGNVRDSFRVTYSQNNDEIVGTLVVREDIYKQLERNKDYELTGEYRSTKSGNYISWSSAKVIPSISKTVL